MGVLLPDSRSTVMSLIVRQHEGFLAFLVEVHVGQPFRVELGRRSLTSRLRGE